MKKLKLRTRLLIIVLAPAILGIYRGMVELVTLEGNLRAGVVEEVKVLTSVATGMISSNLDLYHEGKITYEEAKEHSLAELQGLRYNGGEYFFVLSPDAKWLVHPIKELVGEKTKLPVMETLVKEAVRYGSGNGEYKWNDISKISYVTYNEDYEWIIGTGKWLIQANRTITNALLRILTEALIQTILIAALVFGTFRTINPRCLDYTPR